MAAYQAGAAFVTIAPSFQGVQGAIAGEMERYGDDAGRTFGERWSRSAADSLQSALNDLPQVEITADSSEADQKLADLRARMESLGAAEIGVDIDEGAALAELAAIRDELQAIDRDKVSVDVDLKGIDSAVAQLTALQVAVGALDGKETKVPVDAPGSDRTVASIRKVSDALQDIATKGAVGSIVASGLSAIIPMAAAASAAVTGLGGALAGLGAGAGVLGLAISPVVKALQAQDAAQQATAGSAGGAAKASAAHAQAVEQAAERVKDAQRGVADATEAAHQADEDAAKRVAQAQRSVADAVQSAAQANEDAAGRVEAAQQAVADAHTRAAEQVARAQEAYRRAIEAAARADEQASKRVAQAQKQVQQAREQASRAIQSATRQQQAAERALVDAQADALSAQQRLTQARRDAKQAIDDLNDSIRGGALDERAAELEVKKAEEALKSLGPTALEVAQAQQTLADAQRNAQMSQGDAGAQLAVQEAQQRLAALQASIGGTQEEREAAQIAYDRAVFGLDQVRKKNADLAAQKKKADAEGVDGSEKVKAAVKGVQDAQQGVADAQQRVQDSAQATTDARVQGAERIRSAEQSVRDAIESAQQTHVDGLRRVRDASTSMSQAQAAGARAVQAAEAALEQARERQSRTAADGVRKVQDAEQRLADAREQQTRTHVAGLKRIEDAQRSLAKAQADLARTKAEGADGGAGGGGGAGASKLNEAMAKLTPAGREFLALLKEMQAGMDTLSRTAQETALPGITRALRSLAPAFGPVNKLVGDLGRTLGKLAEDGAKDLRGEFWVGFGKMLTTNLPGWLDKGARILADFGKAFAAVFKAMVPVGNDFLSWLLKASRGVVDWSTKLEQSQGFKTFVKYIRDNAPAIKELFTALGLALVNVTKGMGEMGPNALTVATVLAKIVAAIPPEWIPTITYGIGALSLAVKGLGVAFKISDGITAATTALNAFKESALGAKVIEGLTNGMKALSGGIKAVGMAMITPPLGIVLAIGAVIGALVLLYKNNEDFRRFVDNMVKKIKEFGRAGLDWLRDKVDALVGWLKKNWQTVLVGIIGGPIGLAVKAIVDNWDKIKEATTRKASEIKDAIVRKVGEWRQAIADGASRMVRALGDGLRSLGSMVTEPLGAVARAIWGGITSWTEPFKAFKPWEWLRQAFDTAVEWIRGPVDQIKGMIDSVKNGAKGLASKVDPRNWGWAAGGMVTVPPGFASGGLVPGTPPTRSGIDNLTVPLRDSVGRFVTAVGLRSGEFVQTQEAVDYYGLRFMEAIRRRAIPRQAAAGLVSGTYSGPLVTSPAMGYAAGGLVAAARASVAGSASAGSLGPAIAVLSPDDAAMLAGIASRPVVTSIDGRQLWSTLQGLDKRYATR